MTTTNRDQIAAEVREVILEVKPLEDGFNDLPPDSPLFNDGSEPSPVNLDSLDTLDVVTSIAERFGVDDERLDAFLNGQTDFAAFRTINDIVEFILSANGTTDTQPATTG